MSKIRLRPVSITYFFRWLWITITTILIAIINIQIAPGHIVFDRMLVFVLIMLSLSQLVSKRLRGDAANLLI